jgi:hypothetical protein
MPVLKEVKSTLLRQGESQLRERIQRSSLRLRQPAQPLQPVGRETAAMVEAALSRLGLSKPASEHGRQASRSLCRLMGRWPLTLRRELLQVDGLWNHDQKTRRALSDILQVTYSDGLQSVGPGLM